MCQKVQNKTYVKRCYICFEAQKEGEVWEHGNICSDECMEERYEEERWEKAR